ncbi:MAG: T9SS type A sorting domain-containing protein [Ignavibacteriaceae bacterium]|jgi:hypothetical protein|nr:T9SS type A sorting domain-containing protein [Ignavibacteriaceae bacterium]
MKNSILIIYFILFSVTANSQTLPIPPRPSNALSGSEFINVIWSLPREQREEHIYSQVISGNIPDFMRQLQSVTANSNIGGNNHTATYFAIPEYLAVGSDSDYFLAPMTPLLAQRICNALECTLPTKKMVDQIYSTAPCKLRPQPIPPTGQMTTVPVFAQHNDSVKSIRFPVIPQHPLGTLVGGTKKDVIISNYIYQNLKPNVPRPVVIYGWHQLNGSPIQPVYNGHDETYADYSHGIRLVLDSVIVDGTPKTFTQLLADPVLCVLVSDEGTILKPYYTLSGLTPPSPKTFGVFWNSPTSLKLLVTPFTGTTYKAFYGSDGLTFNDSTSEFTSEIIIDGLTENSLFFFRLRAQTSQGYSLPSEVLAAVTSVSASQVLIVNGFDRGSSGNTYNFIRQHGIAFNKNDYSFSSATNDAVIEGMVSLQDYVIADYILGDESTADETFNSTEQEFVKAFLRNGGMLFVSGAEIAWDLDNKGSSSDKDFINNFLKAKYVNDAPNGQSGVYYQAEPISGSIFDGIGDINFDNGSQGTINVSYPDVINGVNGGINCLRYSNVSNQTAAVNYAGIFPAGIVPGKVVFVGFPFETIYPESKRNLFLSKVIDFFESPVGIIDEEENMPNSFQLFQNYPNPFNPNTTLSFAIAQPSYVTLKVFDVLGKEAATLVNEYKSAGTYKINFQSTTGEHKLTSGVYFYQLQAGDFTQTRKMILLQ